MRKIKVSFGKTYDKFSITDDCDKFDTMMTVATYILEHCDDEVSRFTVAFAEDEDGSCTA